MHYLIGEERITIHFNKKGYTVRYGEWVVVRNQSRIRITRDNKEVANILATNKDSISRLPYTVQGMIRDGEEAFRKV